MSEASQIVKHAAPQIGGDVGRLWGDTTAGFRDPKSLEIGGSVGQAWQFLTKWARTPDRPELKPQPQAANPNLANQTALQAQLDRENQIRASDTNQTSGAGLLDQPTTASRVLLGV